MVAVVVVAGGTHRTHAHARLHTHQHKLTSLIHALIWLQNRQNSPSGALAYHAYLRPSVPIPGNQPLGLPKACRRLRWSVAHSAISSHTASSRHGHSAVRAFHVFLRTAFVWV